MDSKRAQGWRFGALAALALACTAGTATAQARLQAIVPVQPQTFHLQISHLTTYSSQADPSGRNWALLLHRTRSEVGWEKQAFDEGLVSVIEVHPVRQEPPATAVVFRLRSPGLLRVECVPSGMRVTFVDPSNDTTSRPNHVEVPRTRPPEPQQELQSLQERLAQGRLISLDVFDAEISNVLRMLGRQSGVNIVAGSDVTGKITVSLHDVTLDQALENILKANGYTYVIDGDVIRVKKVDQLGLGEMATKVYRLRYIDARALRDAVAEVLSPNAKVFVFSTNFQSGGSAGPTGPAAGQTTRSGTGLQAARRSSVLIVTDLVDNIRHVDRIVEALDIPSPQVMIEAKLIELSPGQTGSLGIDWTKAITVSLYGDRLGEGGTTRPYSALADLPHGKIRYATLSASEFAAVLNYLRENTQSKLISNPRIIAADNEESVISVGETFPVPQINRGVGGQGDIVTFEYKDVNISLRVTPHVSGDQTITMFVNPVIEEVTGEVVIDKNRAPITSKRSVETVVTVKDGETVVIGGLIKENRSETVSKIWLLGDIPLLGHLFRNKKTERKQTDLLIFLTPHILGAP
ncbi:MAG: secretin and TonB N-terminal domain-containing protein [candidate division KSB1 bacterium]|nr:secretin and TonB N-terminal domain-containing protein [candidate division KSB1 bacterium]